MTVDLYADHETERLVLGAVIVDNAAMNALAGMLVPKHFEDKKHQVIWDAMLALYSRSQPIDELMLKAELADAIGNAGGMSYVATLDEGMPRNSNPEPWASTVIERARRRAARQFSSQFMEELNNPSMATEDVIERFQERITRLQAARRDGVVGIRDVLPESIQWLEKFSQSRDGLLGIPCGLPDVDRITCGWQKGTLNIIAARPSRGKSVFVGQSAVFAALQGYKVLMISMEMKPVAVTVRMLCGAAGVDRWDLRMRNGNVSRFEGSWEQVNRAAAMLMELGISFDQREAPTIAQIRAIAKQHQAARGCDLVVVDYLQRCSVPSGVDQWLGVAQVAQGLKSLAQALNIPVLAACQLGADAEEKRPTQRDLAQAKQVIAAEADVIAFLHPEQPAEWRKQDQPTVTFIVDKQRDGATADIPLSFERTHNRFVSLSMPDVVEM